jgi:hypothetical protein
MIAWKYYSGEQIEKNKMGGLCSMFGEKCAYRFLLRKPEGKRPLGRFRRR